jgi:DNA invertase Pin-like site-specific DNA recombinase
MSSIKDFEKLFGIKDKQNNRQKAIVYTRVSTKEQADNNTSLTTQKKFCEEYAVKNGLEVADYFGGTYESAKTDERKEFKRMIQYAKQNSTIGYILIYSYDRFSRSGTNASYIADELKKQGITLVAVTQKVDTSNAGGIMQQDFFFLLSRFDNEMRKDKTKTGMMELLRKGYWLWTPPRGYLNTKKHHRAVDWDIIVTDEGELLRKAFQWRVKNTYSSAEIVRKLNLLGMKINERRLHEIFKNPFYCGILITKMLPGEITLGQHEVIVSQEDFIKINTPESKVVSKTYETMSDDLPLKKSVCCETCGNLMTGFLVKAKGLHYYKCQKKCKGVIFSAKKLHQSFKELLNEYQFDLKELDAIVPEIMQYKLLEMSKSDANEVAAAKTKLTHVRKELDATEERFATGKIETALYNKFSEKYKNEISELEEKLMNPNLTSSNLEKCIKNGFKLSKNLSKIWESGSLFDKHKLQLLLFPDGFAYDKQKGRVQTFRTNVFFDLMRSISTTLSEIKNGDSIKIDQISALVTSLGFKPKTSTAVM